MLGAEFSVTDLAVVTGRPAGDLIDVIGSAQAAGVVADSGHGLAFRHALIRQVLYEQMPAALRASLHARAAQALATSGAAPERIAAQLVAAVGPGTAPGTAREAAPEAAQPWVLDWLTSHTPVLVSRAPQVAADLLRAVIAGLAPGDPRRARLETSLLTPLFLIGQDAEVERVGRGLLPASADPDLGWLVGYSMIRAGRAAEAAAVLREARDAGPVPARGARLSALNGNVLALLGQVEQAAAAAATALADGAGDPLTQGFARYVLSALSYLGRDTRARLDHLDRGIAAVGDDTGLTDLRLLIQANRTNALVDLDRREESLAAGREAVVLGDRIGGPRVLWARTMLGITYYMGGQWGDALTEIEPVLDSETSGYIGPYAHALAALVAARRDQRADAGPAPERGPRHGRVDQASRPAGPARPPARPGGRRRTGRRPGYRHRGAGPVPGPRARRGHADAARAAARADPAGPQRRRHPAGRARPRPRRPPRRNASRWRASC